MEILTQGILTEYIRIISNTATSINYKKKCFTLCHILRGKYCKYSKNTRNGRIIGNFQQIPNSIPMKI